MAKVKSDKAFTVRVTPDELKRAKKCAELDGRSFSSFVKKAMLDFCNKVEKEYE